MAPTSKELAMTQKTQEKHRSSETEQVVDDEQLTAAQHAGQAALDSINEDDIDQVLADIDDVLGFLYFDQFTTSRPSSVSIILARRRARREMPDCLASRTISGARGSLAVMALQYCLPLPSGKIRSQSKTRCIVA
jgi:hypothetical protein